MFGAAVNRLLEFHLCVAVLTRSASGDVYLFGHDKPLLSDEGQTCYVARLAIWRHPGCFCRVRFSLRAGTYAREFARRPFFVDHLGAPLVLNHRELETCYCRYIAFVEETVTSGSRQRAFLFFLRHIPLCLVLYFLQNPTAGVFSPRRFRYSATGRISGIQDHGERAAISAGYRR